MIRPAFLGILLCLMSVEAAVAGAWLREHGTGFLSTAGTVTQAREAGGSLYAEYGLTDTLTLGLDVNGGMDQLGIPTGDGTLFVRFPLTAADAQNKWAAQIGLGARYEPREFFPSAELGLSWGRGLVWGERYGWIAVDATVNIARAPMKRITKVDTTLGLGVSDRFKLMAQLYLTHTNGTLFQTLAPSLLIDTKNGKSTYQIGAEIPISSEDDIRLKLGIWRNF